MQVRERNCIAYRISTINIRDMRHLGGARSVFLEEEVISDMNDVSPLQLQHHDNETFSIHTHSTISFSVGVATRGSSGQAGLSGGRGASAMDGDGFFT